MKIVVLSDTHIPRKAKSIPQKIIPDLQSADYILHAGDWQTLDVYDELSSYATVIGVYGNVDGPELQTFFPKKIVLNVNRFEIGMTHGHGTKMSTEKRALDAFTGEDVDCIVFGHSHVPVLKVENDILIFNPGSLTDKRKEPYYSYGIFTIDHTIHAQHIFF